MKPNLLRPYLFVLFLFLFVTDSGFADSKWSEKMRNLSGALNELLPDLLSDQRFADPKNADRILKNAETFGNHTDALLTSHGMEVLNGKKTPSTVGPDHDTDPSLGILANLFQEQTKRGVQALKSGHRNYGRSLLRSATQYCMNCHTRSTIGPQFSTDASSPILQGLNGEERGTYFSAIRQYDKALEELSKVETERAVRKSLLIAIRAKNDSRLALKTVDTALAKSFLPTFVKNDARQWKKAIQDWIKDPEHVTPTEEGHFAKAQLLFKKAQDAKTYPMDRAGEIDYMRATRVLHDFLRLYPQSKRTPEALYLIAQSYESLQDLGSDSIHELFYESCIYRAKKSETAANCYHRLEEGVYASFTGSAGTHVPPSVVSHLKTLKKEAGVKGD